MNREYFIYRQTQLSITVNVRVRNLDLIQLSTLGILYVIQYWGLLTLLYLSQIGRKVTNLVEMFC
jgi:hypothetical protein